MQYPLQKQELYTRDILETQHKLATKIDTMLLKSRKTQQQSCIDTWEIHLNENIHLEDVIKLFPFTTGAIPLEIEQKMLPTLYINKNKYLEDKLTQQQYRNYLS